MREESSQAPAAPRCFKTVWAEQPSFKESLKLSAAAPGKGWELFPEHHPHTGFSPLLLGRALLHLPSPQCLQWKRSHPHCLCSCIRALVSPGAGRVAFRFIHDQVLVPFLINCPFWGARPTSNPVPHNSSPGRQGRIWLPAHQPCSWARLPHPPPYTVWHSNLTSESNLHPDMERDVSHCKEFLKNTHAFYTEHQA